MNLKGGYRNYLGLGQGDHKLSAWATQGFVLK